jgi:predicted RecB family nuclease
MWDDIPAFLDNTFSNWSYVKAEELLYEEIENKNLNFKGFIDGIIKVPKKRGKGNLYYIIDWKTAKTYGWRREKKQDILMTAQLILYKYFWSRKHNIDMKDIRCGFVLLKRGAKPGKVCEFVPVSVGKKSVEKALKIVNSMIYSINNKMFLKNRNSCKFCPYANTKHCT